MNIEKRIRALRMERQHLVRPADRAEYDALYRDLQPGQNVYWNGFGQPPVLSFRAAFDDIEYNRARQRDRRLVKMRFGGSLGWIVPEDIGLFAALYRKPTAKLSAVQQQVWERIAQGGPATIQQIKADTGLLVKEITPALHRLQEAFLVYEDQSDGEWDRLWHRFDAFFPQMDLEQYGRAEALCTVLLRFVRRMVRVDAGMAKAFYRLPEKELRAALESLAAQGLLLKDDAGYMTPEDAQLLQTYDAQPLRSVYAVHRSDALYKAQEPALKAWAKQQCAGLPYDHEPLQYLLIDGEFCGAVVGHFRNGPYDLNDIVCSLPDAQERRAEIIKAVKAVNFGRAPVRFMGRPMEE